MPPKVFPVPEGVTSVYVDPTTGKLAGNYCENRRLEVFLRGTEPAEYCTEHYAEPEQDSTEQDIERERDDTWWDHFKNWWTK